MNIRRNIRFFLQDHKNLILFVTICIAVIILIIQGLNKIYEEKEKESETAKNQVINTITEETNITEVNIMKHKNLIKNFIDYNQKEKFEEAYFLLSERCKEEMFPTIESYKDNYYNKYFTQEENAEVEYVSNNIYRIVFYKNNAMQMGKENTEISQICECEIQKEGKLNKIYIRSNLN